MKPEPKFEIVEDTADYILIRDLGPWDKYPTITNAPEQVVIRLAPQLDDRRLWYYDSDGHRDQILIEDGKFKGFAPV